MTRYAFGYGCLVLVASLSFSGRALAETCTIPRTGEGIDRADCQPTGSCDTRYVPFWYDPNQPVNSPDFNIQWGGLNCEIDDWDEGWGFDDYNASWGWSVVWSPLARIMNAAWIVRHVEGVMTQPKYQIALPGDVYGAGQWWNFVVNFSDNEWLPGCPGDNDSGATTYDPAADEYVLLRTKGMYLYPAILRAGILVHESAHESYNHEADDDECEAGISCDNEYGNSNANTLGVNFYINAILTPNIGPDGTPYVEIENETCSHNWFFDDNERADLLNKIEDTQSRRYVESSTYPTDKVAELEAAWTWPCKSCADDYTFNIHTCDWDQTACNDVLVPGNATVNAKRRQACEAYEAVANSDPVTAGQIAAARQTYLAARYGLNCIMPNDSQKATYCATQSASADNVADFDTCYNRLPENCMVEWCFDEFQDAVDHNQGDAWLANDPAGCLGYFCGDDTCWIDGADQPICEKGFVYSNGDVEIFAGAQSCESCLKNFIKCMTPKVEAGEWAWGDPYITECKNPYDKCIEMKKAAAAILAHYRDFFRTVIPEYGPGPQERLFEQMRAYSNSPKFQMYSRMREIQYLVGAKRNSPDLQVALARFMVEPEMINALFHAAPPQYNAMSNEGDFGCTLPPTAMSVTPIPITEADLLPGGYEFLWAWQHPRPWVYKVDYPVIAHGGKLVLAGSDFTDASSVTLGGAAQSFTVDSSTQITIAAVADSVPTGRQNIVVTTPNGVSPAFNVTVIHLVINELDSDTAGATDASEFVEIATGVPGVSLAGYVLVGYNGAARNDASYLTIDLGPAGKVTDSNGLLLLANPGLTAADITFPNNTLNNGAAAAAIHQGSATSFPNGTAASNQGLIDALVYDTNQADDTALIAALLGSGAQALQIDESGGGTNAEAYAVIRCPDRPARLDGRAYIATRPPSPKRLNTCSF